MTLRNIHLADVSRFRGELMGAAILFIILFHVPLSRGDAFFGLRRCGNVGVDMFLFLSGMGLWFAWVKNPSVRHFYLRRMLRLLPVWLVVAVGYYLPRFDWQWSHVPDFVGDVIVNWGFWHHGELAFWYIPAIMMLYLWAPLYLRLIQRAPLYRWLPVLAMVWCVAVQWVGPVHQAVGHLEIFWSRVPVFLIGINCGELVRRKVQLDATALWLIVVTFAATAALCIYLEQMLHGRFPLFIERMVYIPLTLTLLILLCRLLAAVPSWARRGLAFVGGLSLELYLIHNHFVLQYLIDERLGYWPTALLTIALTLPLAWLLHWLIKKIVRT